SPCFSLFPYTTLFRSMLNSKSCCYALIALLLGACVYMYWKSSGGSSCGCGMNERLMGPKYKRPIQGERFNQSRAFEKGEYQERLDRKSTRLNSSHLVI